MVLLGILLVAAGILILAVGDFRRADTIGFVIAVAGVLLIMLAAVDLESADAAIAGSGVGAFATS